MDMLVPRCACRSEAIIDAVVLAIGKWQQSLEGAPKEQGPEPDHEVRP